MGRLTRQIGLVALGRAAGTLGILVVNAILARAWAPEEMGLYSTAWVLVNTLVPLFLLGLPTSLLYFAPRRSAGARAVLVLQTTGCLLGSGLLLATLLYVSGPRLALLLDPGGAGGWEGLADCLWPFLPYAFSLVAGGLAEPALVAAGRSGWQAGLAGGLAVGLVAAAWLGKALGLGAAQVLGWFSVLGLARLLIAWWLVGRALWVPCAARRGAGLGECLRYAFPVALSDTVGSFSRSVDRLVVAVFFSTQTFALYHLAAIEVPMGLLLSAAATVLVPEVSRLYSEGRVQAIGELWRATVRRLSTAVLPLCCFLFIFAGQVVVVLYSESYASAAWVFRIFVLALPLRCALYNPVLVGMGKARWALWGGVGDLLLNAALSLLLVQVLFARLPEYAHLGPALAAVISTYAQVFFLVGMIVRHLRWGIGQLLPWGHLLRVALVCGLAGLAGSGAASWGRTPLAELVLGGAAFAAVLGAAARLEPQYRQAVRELFRF